MEEFVKLSCERWPNLCTEKRRWIRERYAKSLERVRAVQRVGGICHDVSEIVTNSIKYAIPLFVLSLAFFDPTSRTYNVGQWTVQILTVLAILSLVACKRLGPLRITQWDLMTKLEREGFRYCGKLGVYGKCGDDQAFETFVRQVDKLLQGPLKAQDRQPAKGDASGAGRVSPGAVDAAGKEKTTDDRQSVETDETKGFSFSV